MDLGLMKRIIMCPKNVVLLAALLLGAGLAASPATAKGVSYKPGISLVPEVFRPDGVTDDMYETGQGLSLWSAVNAGSSTVNTGMAMDHPVPQGDKVKLSVFAATGGGELKEIKIRLDNVLIADIAKAPWHTTLDTEKLGNGVHMIEVWAVATGDNPQSTTQTLSFQVDPAFLVKGIQEAQGPNGQSVENVLSGTPAGTPDTFSDAPPKLPDYLKTQILNPDATVTITARSAASSEQAGGATLTDTPVTVNEPTLFIVQPAVGSPATRFAYAIVRGGVTVSSSPEVLRTAYDRIRIERRSDTQAGLRPGKVTLWIWGVDKQGNYSNPVKTYLDIPSDK